MAEDTPTELPSVPCKEFSEFKEALQDMRALDDRVIYKLNTSIPTTSFADQVNAPEQCKGLYQELRAAHKSRQAAIQQCIDLTSKQVDVLREKRKQSPDSHVTKDLRNEQTKLRLMQNELTVEEVVRDRSIKVFKERCWQSFKPPEW